VYESTIRLSTGRAFLTRARDGQPWARRLRVARVLRELKRRIGADRDALEKD
jgi:hypothetical protein